MVLVEVEIMFNLKWLSLKKKKNPTSLHLQSKAKPTLFKGMSVSGFDCFWNATTLRKAWLLHQQIQESQGVKMYHYTCKKENLF